MKTQIKTDNRMIAQFYKGESVPESWNWNYHDNWDSLMPVIEKIESLGYFCMINKWTSVYTGSEKNGRISITTVEGKSKLTNTYQAVIKFIEWYNENES